MKLNLGCGKQRLEGFINVDLHDSDQDVDLSVFPWPWQDDTVDEIVASHILEHFSKENAYKFLGECYRVLSMWGVLWLAVPDMDKFIQAHLTGDFSPLNGYKWTDLNYLCGGDETEHKPEQRHQYMYNRETLAHMAMARGFTTAYAMPMQKHDNPDYEAISLYMRASKTP